MRRFIRPRLGANPAYQFESMLRAACAVKARYEYLEAFDAWRGLIKDKDLDHLATVKRFGIPHLVAFDRDYLPFPEYRTPRQFVSLLGRSPQATDY